MAAVQQSKVERSRLSQPGLQIEQVWRREWPEQYQTIPAKHLQAQLERLDQAANEAIEAAIERRLRAQQPATTYLQQVRRYEQAAMAAREEILPAYLATEPFALIKTQ